MFSIHKYWLWLSSWPSPTSVGFHFGTKRRDLFHGPGTCAPAGPAVVLLLSNTPADSPNEKTNGFLVWCNISGDNLPAAKSPSGWGGGGMLASCPARQLLTANGWICSLIWRLCLPTDSWNVPDDKRGLRRPHPPQHAGADRVGSVLQEKKDPPPLRLLQGQQKVSSSLHPNLCVETTRCSLS